MPYKNVEYKSVHLIDYSYWHLPYESRDKLFINIKRIDLKELYATIYLNLFENKIINSKNEPDIINSIPIIKQWKDSKKFLPEDEKKNLRKKINSLYLRGLKNKYLLYQVLTNLLEPIKDKCIYIDTDVIYLESITDDLITHLNSIYGKWPSELTVTEIDFLYIIRHKLVAEQSQGNVKTNLDRLAIHRQNNTVRTKIISDNEKLHLDFGVLIRNHKLKTLLK